MINFTHSFPFSYSLFLSTAPFVYLFLAAERTAEIGVSVGSVLRIGVSERPLMRRQRESANGKRGNAKFIERGLFIRID